MYFTSVRQDVPHNKITSLFFYPYHNKTIAITVGESSQHLSLAPSPQQHQSLIELPLELQSAIFIILSASVSEEIEMALLRELLSMEDR